MSTTATLQTTVSAGGVSINARAQRTAEGQIGESIGTDRLPAAKTATAWTQTDADTGVATLSSGHGLTTGQEVDVYWSGGVRYGCSISVSGDDVTIDGGAGDDFPASGTDVIVAPLVYVDTDFDGDDLGDADTLKGLIAIFGKYRCHWHFKTSEASGVSGSLMARELQAGEAWSWVSGQGQDNPLTGVPVDRICVSNGDGTYANELKLVVLRDNVS